MEYFNYDFEIGDLVVFRLYDLRLGKDPDSVPPFFQIEKIDDMGRVWYDNECIGISYIRYANDFEINWYKKITNPRKQKLLKIKNSNE